MDAIQELKMVVSEYVKKGDERGVDRFIGYDWFQVCDDEEGVFELYPIEMNLLVAVYEFYEVMLGVCYTGFETEKKELCVAVRKALPWLKPEMHSASNFMKFADIFGVSPDKAYCMYFKQVFWEYRSGLVEFKVPD